MNRPSIGRAHLSIGEVLSLLQDEFPDVTISKIRFLESQGLLDPERTPSGYRKFYEYDIERLRWILRLQKDHYLPLKVIKDRLDEAGGIPPADMVETPDDVEAEAEAAERAAEANAPTLFATTENGSAGRVALGDRHIRVVAPPTTGLPPSQQPRRTSPRPPGRTGSGGTASTPSPAARSSSSEARSRAAAPRVTSQSAPAQAPVRRPQQGAAGRSAGAAASGGGAGGGAARSGQSPPQARSRQAQRPAGSRASGRQPAAQQAQAPAPAAPRTSSQNQGQSQAQGQPRTAARASTSDPTAAAPAAASPADSRPLAGVGLEAGPDAVSLTLDELVEASGLSHRDLRDLERFGLIEPRDGATGTHYDGDALIVARTAAGFLQHGIEARHMRSYKVAVDREAGLFEQIVSPVLKQRNPEARVRAARTITELIRLGEVMRGVLLRRELRDHLGGS